MFPRHAIVVLVAALAAPALAAPAAGLATAPDYHADRMSASYDPATGTLDASFSYLDEAQGWAYTGRVAITLDGQPFCSGSPGSPPVGAEVEPVPVYPGVGTGLGCRRSGLALAEGPHLLVGRVDPVGAQDPDPSDNALMLGFSVGPDGVSYGPSLPPREGGHPRVLARLGPEAYASRAGDAIPFAATVRNEGLATLPAGLRVTFRMDGAVLGEGVTQAPVAPGLETAVGCGCAWTAVAGGHAMVASLDDGTAAEAVELEVVGGAVRVELMDVRAEPGVSGPSWTWAVLPAGVRHVVVAIECPGSVATVTVAPVFGTHPTQAQCAAGIQQPGASVTGDFEGPVVVGHSGAGAGGYRFRVLSDPAFAP